MLSLAYANRMEVLLEPLATRISQAQADDPFSPVELIVPNRSIAQFIRLHVAERLGVAANLEFHFLRRFFVKAVEGEGQAKILDARALQLLIFHQIKDPARLDDPVLDPVRGYLELGDEPEEWARRALQLAGHLARLFEEYALHRRGLIEGWFKGRLLNEPTHLHAERWQRALWLRLFNAEGRLRQQPQWSLLPDAVLRRTPFSLNVPPQAHLIGFSYLAPVYAELLSHASLGMELCVYTLNPCLEFWEDVDAGIEARRDGWARHRQRVLNLDGQDPFELDQPTDTPALRLWGRPGREFVRLLNELTDCDFIPLFVDPQLGARPSARARGPLLLHALQREILRRAPERPAVEPGEGVEEDDSVRFLACPSVRREAEIVADQIWSLISEDDVEGGDLRFHEIAVLVTQRDREVYLTHLEAAFQERYHIPLNVIDRPLSSSSRVIEAIHRLLALPLGALSVGEVLPLLTHPAVLSHADIDAARWRRWCEGLNIRFGADAAALEGTYIEGDVYHWDQGLRRLALGAFMVGEAFGELRPFEAPSGAWLPFDTPPDAALDVTRFIDRARALISDAQACRAARLPLAEWSMLLSRLTRAYITPRTVEDERALDRGLRALEALAEIDLDGAPIDFETAQTLANAQLNALESHRGQHQADGVVIAALEPMRAVPYRVIFAVGMGEGVFPKTSHDDPLDLRRARRRAGDVTPSERDRYLFLETLLSARERLYLSYVNVDPRTGEPLEPSALIRELQYILRGHVDREALSRMTVTWPRSVYDPRCYPSLDPDADPALESVSAAGLLGAQAAALRADLERRLGRRPPEHEALLRPLSPATTRALAPLLQIVAPPQEEPQPGRLELPLVALEHFLRSPLQGAARFVLGLDDEGVNLLDDAEDEPLSPASRARFMALRAAFWAGGGDAAAAAAAWRAGFARH
ncbi:exodeoxyribonuclease V subunit gamma, partial [Myxococcota bacterium]|nr:exodeoxyribonuclease V subunit gamma [Myxococcota bacterium]